jgi:amiloride-sensitive sodium channel
VWYNPEISNAPFPGRGFNLTRTFQRLVERLNVSRDVNTVDYFANSVGALHVYYKEKTGERYKIDIRFGIEDFICKQFFYQFSSPIAK